MKKDPGKPKESLSDRERSPPQRPLKAYPQPAEAKIGSRYISGFTKTFLERASPMLSTAAVTESGRLQTRKTLV
jgi:hypothetical protein